MLTHVYGSAQFSQKSIHTTKEYVDTDGTGHQNELNEIHLGKVI